MDLRNKVILVTGGARRIGRAISEELLKAGARVFIHHNNSAAEADSIRKTYKNAEILCADLSRNGEAKRLVDAVAGTTGKIDGLINNAAIYFKSPFGKITEDQWDKLFSLNLKAAFFCAQQAAKHMYKGACIINIGDTSGLSPWPSYLPYSLTKAGIIAMTKGLAKALAPDIRVNCINPGPVLLPDDISEQDRKQAVGQTLLKREGQATDIAVMVRFLLENGEYMTGAVVNVDGGRSIR